MAVSPLARTPSGDLLGAQSAGVIQFRGVPYAQPPIGALRFAPPRPITPWTNLRDASQHGPIPLQPPSRLRTVLGEINRPQSEDCLTLTITTPAPDNRARPVLVWLHGGAFVSGAGSLDWYDGTLLACEGDQVVVSVNYRLGPLGFLYQPGISNGKQGLLDVVAALQWVQEHIHCFGGDPSRVTVAGQSAGAHMILCLLAQPDTRHLFQRAILQSAPAGVAPFSLATAREYGNIFLDILHIEQGPSEAVASALRAETSTHFIEAMGKLAQRTARFAQLTLPFMPVIDELSTRERFLQAAATGAGAAGVDLIIGTTREEAHAFLLDGSLPEPDPQLFVETFSQLTGDEDAIKAYQLRRPGGTPLEVMSDFMTGSTILFPSLRFAEAASRAGARTWVYQFNWAPPLSPLRACHCLELPFVFGNFEAWSNAPMMRGTDPTVFEALSAAMRASWTNFVQNGDPSFGIAWPEYQAKERQTMLWDGILGAMGDPAGANGRLAKKYVTNSNSWQLKKSIS